MISLRGVPRCQTCGTPVHKGARECAGCLRYGQGGGHIYKSTAWERLADLATPPVRKKDRDVDLV